MKTIAIIAVISFFGLLFLSVFEIIVSVGIPTMTTEKLLETLATLSTIGLVQGLLVLILLGVFTYQLFEQE